jgi:hypothetical protein
MPVIEVEHNGIGRGLTPAVLRLDVCGTHHRTTLGSMS